MQSQVYNCLTTEQEGESPAVAIIQVTSNMGAY